ncbi:DUF4129 domain-containing protein [Sphingomonas sp. LHG3443-2]|uniref:DUF4129 domain-containing protein n=1 Tax=Sphingomonas sp. LHG3443-2 TaxID=2804639 RepID=UPI003CEAF697
MAKGETTQPFDRAWEALKADPSVQFNLTPAPPDPKPPEWLEAIGRFFQAILRPVGHFFQWLFGWLPGPPATRLILGVLLAAGVAALLWMIVDRARRGDWRFSRRQRAAVAAGGGSEQGAWLPQEMPVRSWLEEADELARQNRFADAVRCLLLRSVEDMATRRPDAVRPGLTSRELARSALLTERARPLFAGLARLVEDSHFGGREVGESGWREAREAYGSFALPETWRA